MVENNNESVQIPSAEEFLKPVTDLKSEDVPVVVGDQAPAAEEPEQPAGEAAQDAPDESSHIGEPGVTGLFEEMIGYLKRYAGYPFCSASVIKALPKTEAEMSGQLRAHIMKFMMRGGTNAEDFVKAYADGSVVFFQVHKELPKLNENDGLYDNVLPDGQPNKTIAVCQKQIVNPTKFEAVIIQKTGPDSFNVIKGNPYAKLSDAEVAEALKTLQPQCAGSEPAEA